MTAEPCFLSLEEVLEIHAQQLAAHGGQAGVRDQGALESAIAQPQASFGGEYLHEDLYAMAAAYAFHIAENQPFIDGNKRTAINVALTFLGLNDVILAAPWEQLYDALMQLATHDLNKEGLAELFRGK